MLSDDFHTSSRIRLVLSDDFHTSSRIHLVPSDDFHISSRIHLVTLLKLGPLDDMGCKQRRVGYEKLYGFTGFNDKNLYTNEN